jgi:hypothetical protein
MAQQQNFVIPALPVPVGLQALQIAAPAAVLYGPNLPIADAAVTAEHQYVKIIKRLKATNGNLVTDAEYVSASKRKTAVQNAAAEQTYPGAGAPLWGQQLVAQMNAMQNTLQVMQNTLQGIQNTQQVMQNTLQDTQVLLQVSLQLPSLRARNAHTIGLSQGALYPLPSTVAGPNMGLLPQAANPVVFFPPTLAAADALTLAQIAALAAFYGIAFNGTVADQRGQFKSFISIG